MRTHFINAFLLVFILVLLTGCESKKGKIKTLLEKECNCESIRVENLQVTKKEEILSYSIINPVNQDFKAEVHRLIYLIQQEEPDFCVTDQKIIFQFKTKSDTTIYSFKNCVPKQEK